MNSDLLISQADRRPMYLQIMEQIRHRIAVGDWQPGQEMPSIRALAAAVQVSVITVKRAYLELERERRHRDPAGQGIVRRRQRRPQRAAAARASSTTTSSAAADIGRELGLTPEELESRLRESWHEQDAKDEQP